MSAAIRALSTAITASSSFPTPMPSSPARNRSTSTACASAPARSGGRRAASATASMSISGTTTSTRRDGAMTASPALDGLPALPLDAEGPVFAEAWQAQAFAMAIELSRLGCFTWGEWAAALAAEIKAAQAKGDPDLGNTYYHHWLAALEKLVAAKGLLGIADLAARKEAWVHAIEHTAFG